MTERDTMAKSDARPVVVLLSITTAVTLFFIPLARAVDSAFPGPHMGFSLLGVWLFWVIPGALFLSGVTVYFWQKAAKHSDGRQRLITAAALIYALFFVICMLGYRRML